MVDLGTTFVWTVLDDFQTFSDIAFLRQCSGGL